MLDEREQLMGGRFEGKREKERKLSRRGVRFILAFFLAANTGLCLFSYPGENEGGEKQEVIPIEEKSCKNPPPPEIFCPGGIPSVDCFPYGGSIWDPLCGTK